VIKRPTKHFDTAIMTFTKDVKNSSFICLGIQLKRKWHFKLKFFIHGLFVLREEHPVFRIKNGRKKNVLVVTILNSFLSNIKCQNLLRTTRQNRCKKDHPRRKKSNGKYNSNTNLANERF